MNLLLVCTLLVLFLHGYHSRGEAKHKPTLSIPVAVYYDDRFKQSITRDTNLKSRRRISNYIKQIINNVTSTFISSRLPFELNLQHVIKDDSQRGGKMNRGRFCAKQSKMKRRAKWWFSIGLTGFKNKTRSGSAGHYYEGQFCSKAKSCIVTEWAGDLQSYLIARLIGYSIGLSPDDGLGDHCKPGFSIMSEPDLAWISYLYFNRTVIPPKWSMCSRSSAMSFLRSKRSTCLFYN